MTGTRAESLRGGGVGLPRFTLAATLLFFAVVAFIVGAGNGGTAHAAGTFAAQTCPTDYSGATFPCATTTTSVGTGATVSVGYSNGHLTVSACGFASADSGSTAQLYVDGTPVPTSQGGTGTINSSGCVDFSATQCLSVGTHTISVVDTVTPATGPASATGSLSVSASGCTALGTGSGSATGGSTGTAASSKSGSLAFTGAWIAKFCLFGVALIAVGWLIVHNSKRRRLLEGRRAYIRR